MDERSNLPWPRIHEYLLQIEQADNLKDLYQKALSGLNRIVPFDGAYVSLLNEKAQVADYETIAVPDRLIRQYLDYYGGIDPCKSKPLETKTWHFDWRAFRHTEFGFDFARPARLSYSTGMALFHQGDKMPAANIITFRSGKKDYTDSELASLEVIQAHLSNLLWLHEKARHDLINYAIEPWRLTKREKEIASLLCQGLSTQAIGSLCLISQFTVYRHINNIFEKMHVSSRPELIAKLLRIEAEADRAEVDHDVSGKLDR